MAVTDDTQTHSFLDSQNRGISAEYASLQGGGSLDPMVQKQ